MTEFQNVLTQLGSVKVTNIAALDAWFAAYADAANSTAFINWIGDSLVFGVNSESDASVIANSIRDPLSAPGQLGEIFAREFGVGYAGSMTPFFTGTDSRVSPNALTVSSTTGPLGMVGRGTSTSGSYVQFATPNCTSVDILFYNDDNTPNTGSFEYTVDGGTAVAVPLSSPFNANKTISITGLANTTHTIRLTSTHATNQNYWQGIRFHHGKGVCVARYSRPGWTSNDALGKGALNAGADANGQTRLALGIHAGSPSLTVITLGHNDWGKQSTEISTPAVYKSNLQMMINQAPGSVLLVSSPLPPTESTPDGGAPITDYWDMCTELAAENVNVAHLRLGDIFTPGGNVLRSVTLGYNAVSTSIHQSRKGYGSWARVVHEVLTGRFTPLHV